MAGIDKIYVSSYEEYAEIRDFFKSHEFTTRDGNHVKLKWFLCQDDTVGTEKDRKCIREWYSDGDEHPATNTPQYVDEWLFHNCPLESVQNYLRFAYGEDVNADTFKPKEKPAPAKKVVIKKKGRLAANYPLPYHKRKVFWVSVDAPDYDQYWYNERRDKWYRMSDMEPWHCNNFHTDKSVKSIIRKILKKWQLPAGVTVRITGRYIGEEWVLKTK